MAVEDSVQEDAAVFLAEVFGADRKNEGQGSQDAEY
jgi:hypothetical protein